MVRSQARLPSVVPEMMCPVFPIETSVFEKKPARTEVETLEPSRPMLVLKRLKR